MANLNNFNANQVEPTSDFEPITAGKYLAIITESELKPTKSGSGSYLQLTFQILEGEYKGRFLWSRLNLHNANATAVQIAQAELSAICRAVGVLMSLFPEAVCEGKLDFEILKQLLGGVVDEREEKYGLNWHGKRRARQLALTPSTGTLRPCPEESVDWDTTQNLMIEGDSQVVRDEVLTEAEVYRRYAKRIFQTQMPQSSIRPRVMEKCKTIGIASDLFSIEYVPKSGRNKGAIYEQFYKGDNFRLLAWLGDVTEEIDGRLFKKDLQGTFWNFVGETKNLTKEGDTPFPNGKKPLALVKRLLELDGDPNSLIVDFFAGSGTTGHAVMKQNVADHSSRRFILVQLPEFLDVDDEEQSSAIEYCDKIGKPRNIAEMTKERLRRAGKKIREENPKFAGDLGFRVFKLDSSNVNAWEPDRENLDQTLLDSMEHIKSDRDENNVLYELLLKLGLDLCVPIEQKTTAKKVVHSIGAGALIVCLATKISRDDAEPLALGIIDWHKQQNPAGESTVVFRDSAFADDVSKTNLAAILQQHGLENVRSL